MSQAASCSEGMWLAAPGVLPAAAPVVMKASSRGLRARPSRFLRMRSIMWIGASRGMVGRASLFEFHVEGEGEEVGEGHGA